MVLQDLRLQRAVSQRDVAKALGISDASVCYHETGKKFPRRAIQKKYDEYYGVSLDWELMLKIGEYSALTIMRNTEKPKILRIPKLTKKELQLQALSTPILEILKQVEEWDKGTSLAHIEIMALIKQQI